MLKFLIINMGIILGTIGSVRAFQDITSKLPISGYCPEKYHAFDNAMLEFMKKRGFQSATLTVTYKKKVLINRSYGWQNKTHTIPLKPSAHMRIASLSKMFTAAAIRKLAAEKKFSLNDYVFEYLGELVPLRDQRVRNITIKNLLEHKGGWPAEESLRPLFSLQKIAKTFNKKSDKVTTQDIINYMLAYKALDNSPGKKQQYSNFGFLILGQVVEKASGMPYIKYIKEQICKPLHIYVDQASDERKDSTIKNEIDWYSINVMPTKGNYSLELATSSFGLITSSQGIARFLNVYWANGKLRGKKPLHEAFAQFGSLPGTTALARQRVSGACISLVINSRDDNNWKSDDEILKTALDNAANSVGL